MPKSEEKQASENGDGRMPAADEQQKMIEWAERVLQTFTPQDAMTAEQFVDAINAQRYSVIEYHEKTDAADAEKRVAKFSDEAKKLLDPVSNQIEWGGLNEGGEAYINTAPRGMPATNVYAAISFSELADDIPAVQKLTAFDEYVLENVFTFILVYGEQHNGEIPLVSISQICLAMTNGKTRGGRLYEQVKASVEKMRVTTIIINNTEEIEEGADYPVFREKRRGVYLLPFEWHAIEYRGQEEIVLQFLKKPALLAFAEGRNQIATISRELATCPGKRTPMRLNVYRYLLRLLLLNNGPSTIKFDTIYEHCGITDEREKYRMQNDYLKEFFIYFKKCGLIENYSIKKQQKKVTFTRVKKGVKKLENKH